MEFSHKPVLLMEVVEGLKCYPGGIYVDGTVGGGGHSIEIAKKILPGGRLICIDRDMQAIKSAKGTLSQYSDNTIFVHDNFKNIKSILEDLKINSITGMVLDLGVSSFQLDEVDRGFSYSNDAPLDMRMDTTKDRTAEYLINNLPEEELKRIIKIYGEEKWAARIASFIAKERLEYEIKTTGQLVDIIKRAIPAPARRKGGHPAKRTFQALRIEVNEELDELEQAIIDIIDLLDKGGRLCIISFHSLEDRIVKKTFKKLLKVCSCPQDLPVCACGNKPSIGIITPRPIVSGQDEITTNPRAKSAKLRVCEKV